MGTQSSLPERPMGNSSRSASPLADPAVYGDGFDGLPRVPSTMPDFAATYGDMPDGLPRFSTQPKPEKKKKKKKKRTSRVRSSSQPVEEQQAPQLELQNNAISREDERVANTGEGNSDIPQEGVNGYVLEADVLEDHQTKVEPASWHPAPEPPSSKKKKRSRKSKATSAADEPDQLLSPDITAGAHDLDYGLGGAEAEGAAVLAISSPTEPTFAHKKRKRDKKVNTNTKEVTLDLEEDPIAGSEEEDVALSSPQRKRRSTDDNEGSSSRKKPRRGRISSPVDPVEDFEPSQNTIQSVHRAHRDTSRNTQGEISAMGQAFSKWKAREAMRARELAQDDRGGDPQDPGNPVHKDGGHRKDESPGLPSPRPASQRLEVVLTQQGADFSDGYAPLIGAESSPDVEITGEQTGPGDGGVEQDAANSDAELDHDAMDMDEAPPGSDEDLGMHDDNESGNEDGDDESMQPGEDEREEGSVSHASPDQITPAPAEQAPDEDHIILSSSSDEEERDEPSLPGASETSSNLNGSEVITANGDLKASQRTPNFPNGQESTKLSPRRDSLDESADNDVHEPPSDDEQADPLPGGAGGETSESVGSEPENGADHEPSDEDVEMDGAASEEATKAARPSTPNGHHAEPALATPGSKKSRALPTPGSKKTRSYSRLRPKPSFFEREAEDNARAFAELPSNETAAPPKKTRAKRRLPIDVPADSQPSSSAPGTTKKRKTTANGRRASYIAAREDEQPTFNGSGFRQGPLTQSEISQVTRALDEFREEYQMAQYDLNAMIHVNPRGGPSTHRELWQRVQNACPTRARGKLMSWCRLQFHNFVARGTWTEEQDDELRQMVKRHGKKWAEIGKSINRHQDDVRDRWRNYLVCSDKQNIRQWGDDEMTEFVGIISEGLRLAQRMREEEPDNDELRALSNEQLIDWALVSEKMGFSRSRLQCQEKWKRMRDGGKLGDDITALLSPVSSSRVRQGRKKLEEIPAKDQYRLVRQVLRSGAKKDARIPWDTLVQRFGGRFKRQTLVMAWDRLRETVPDAEVSTTLDCAQHLVDAFEADGISATDTENDEASDAQEPVKVKGWTPVSTRKGKGKLAAAAAAAAQRSSEMAVDSDSDVVPESEPEEDPSSGGDSSRANGNKNSASHRPASPGAETPEQDDYEYVPGSKSSGVERGRGARGGSVDLSMDVDMDKDQDQDEPTPIRKASKGKTKDKGRRKSAKLQTDVLSSSPRESRKRPRADQSPEQTRSARAKKKVKRNGLLLSALESENGYDGGNKNGRRNGIASELSSNMSDMDDIPARVPLAYEDGDE